MEAHRIGHAQRHELAVDQRFDRVRHIAGCHRSVAAEPEGVKLIDPGVVARLRRAGLVEALELRSGKLIERPAFRTVPAVRDRRTVERAFALLAIEASHVAAREWDPD